MKTTSFTRRAMIGKAGVALSAAAISAGGLYQAPEASAGSAEIDDSISIPVLPTGQLNASWVHGNAVVAEDPDFTKIKRLGYHAEIDSDYGITLGTPFKRAAWIHFVIPTPVIINGQRAKILRVMMNFLTQTVNAKIETVHIYDGPNRIAAFEHLGLNLEHAFQTFDIPNTPQVQWGVGVSIQYVINPMNQPRLILFRSIGADFEV
jgi:hypothetical protein